MLSLFIFFSFIFGLSSSFFHKIKVLLCIEGLFFSCIYKFSFLFSLSHLSYFFIFVFSLFMVLDSVFGVSLLIAIGRSSGCHSSWLFFDDFHVSLFFSFSVLFF